jgi:hypothetical protein
MALRGGRVAGALACFVIVGAIGWGGYSAFSTLIWLHATDVALASSQALHASNKDAKGDRLPAARYQLASLTAQPTIPWPVAPASAPTALALVDPSAPLVTEMPAPAPETNAVLAPPRPAAPPRHAEKPKPKPSNGLLDDAQIASIKGRLRLTAEQEGYWPPVEAALRDVVKQQQREASRKKDALAPVTIDVNSPEVQRLTWAAMPLLMRMREDQKREVRTLARVIGLDAVASQI